MRDVVTEPGATHPTISCLMVTLPIERRFEKACASIEAFCRQTYPSKELVLVMSGGDEPGRDRLIDYVQELGRSDIRSLVIPGDAPLGVLRNASLAHAQGDIICQWDDDDLHHPHRLEQQARPIIEGGHDAVLLQDVMQYFPATGTLYWTNWRATDAQGHPGTLMARSSLKIVYPEDGADARLGEDLRVALALHEQRHIHLLEGLPFLFVYVSHGQNSWHDDHHRSLVEQLSISTGLLRKREALLRDGLSAHFPIVHRRMATPIQVMGGTGPAFEI